MAKKYTFLQIINFFYELPEEQQEDYFAFNIETIFPKKPTEDRYLEYFYFDTRDLVYGYGNMYDPPSYLGAQCMISDEYHNLFYILDVKKYRLAVEKRLKDFIRTKVGKDDSFTLVVRDYTWSYYENGFIMQNNQVVSKQVSQERGRSKIETITPLEEIGLDYLLDLTKQDIDDSNHYAKNGQMLYKQAFLNPKPFFLKR